MSKSTSAVDLVGLIDGLDSELPNPAELFSYAMSGGIVEEDEIIREEEYQLFSKELKSLFGEEKYNQFVSYIAARSAFQLLTDESSPLYGIINTVLGEMHDELIKIQSTVSDKLKDLRLENKSLRQHFGSLSSELNVASQALTAVRKRLKGDSVKQDLDECRKIRNKKGTLTDLEQLLLRLEEVVKDCLCSIKQH